MLRIEDLTLAIECAEPYVFDFKIFFTMSRLDLVIFGATGFTGKHAVMECARIAKKNPSLTWGIAGRSQSKLDALLEEASKETGVDLSAIPVMLADVGDEDSLRAMCQRAKVLVNCCGPYRLYGEPVVSAAVRCGAHYVDVSGEPQFLESMQLRYDSAARDAGVFVICACGFDSIPNDMGVVFLQQNFDGTLNSVESYLSTELPPQYQAAARRGGVINYGTWASLVYGLANYHELKTLRKQLFPDRLPALKPKLEKKRCVHFRDGRWCVPFPGSDASVVFRTQRRSRARPVQFRAYLRLPGAWAAPLVWFCALALYLLARCGPGRRWLLSRPRLCSLGLVGRGGLERPVTENTRFGFALHGAGWPQGVDPDSELPTKTLTAKVSGSNPGYGATVVALLHSALTILDERDKMPERGGVVTTGFAFGNTGLVRRLNENGLRFEIVEE
ncbi:unnamed protein product, partial [Iphiclides podalirius]